MLTFVDEILLLMLDDEKGSFLPIRESTMGYVLAGAVLMDLAFANRIDTDPNQLMVLDKNPIGHQVHDRILDSIAGSTETRDTKAWIETISREATEIRNQSLSSLIDNGILESQEEKFLWVFRARRYPTIDGRAEREVKLRITGVLLSDETPDPKDVAIICLADGCNILRDVFSDKEINRIRPRIDQIRKLDLIGREVSGAIMEIEQAIMAAMTHAHH
jgi:hypothetical protein